MSDSLQFNSLDAAFYENDLFLLGEVHEIETSPRVDFALFTQLHEEMGIDTYLAEMDLAQGYYLEQYIKGSNAVPLDEILKEWVVYIGSISTQFRHRWEKLRAYYATLPEGKKFNLVGIDRTRDLTLSRKLLLEKLPAEYHSEIPEELEALIAWADSDLSEILSSTTFNETDRTLLENMYFNLSEYHQVRYRNAFMYENFKRYHAQNNWSGKKLYGGFGFAHTLQAYSQMFAGKIKKDTTLGYSDKMVSLNTMYVDSKLTVQSKALPKFMQDKGQAFTKFNYSQDNRIFLYVKGIADYKKVTTPNSISLIKLDAENSPYKTSTRGTKVKQLISIWEGFDIIDGTATTDYAQYIIFVRNADWIEPDVISNDQDSVPASKGNATTK